MPAIGVHPFVEAWITGDRREHHLLDRPRNAPVSTGRSRSSSCSRSPGTTRTRRTRSGRSSTAEEYREITGGDHH
ncbi:hypothetical protein [Streptomyces sp. NBC_01314]|uniref:hypothetical protein n=1 Tax=Streptomyces sp. NBC_01314 TaxID=2903821 RepID=UPI00352C32B4